MSNSVWPRRCQPTRLSCPWDSPGKNAGVGCHFLLQCMKVKKWVKLFSRVRLLATPWTAAFQAPPSMGYSRQEYWSGVPLPSPRIHTHLHKENIQNSLVMKTLINLNWSRLNPEPLCESSKLLMLLFGSLFLCPYVY